MGVRLSTLIKWHGVHVGEKVHLGTSTVRTGVNFLGIRVYVAVLSSRF